MRPAFFFSKAMVYTIDLYNSIVYTIAMIKTIQASALRSSFKSALTHVKKSKQPLIITERGIPTSVLVSIDEYEDYLSTHDLEFMASIKSARAEYKKGKVYNFADVFGEIN